MALLSIAATLMLVTLSAVQPRRAMADLLNCAYNSNPLMPNAPKVCTGNCPEKETCFESINEDNPTVKNCGCVLDPT